MKLVDIGVNFHSKQLDGLEQFLVERARAEGLVAIVATGTSILASRRAREVSLRYPGYVYWTAGIHPHAARDWSPLARAELTEMLADPTCVACGEAGLDFNRNFSTPASQRHALEQQLELAVTSGKPLFLHCRDAFVDFVPMLRNAMSAGAHGIVHCFTGTAAEAETFIDLGLDIGVTGWVTDKMRGTALRDAVKLIPLNRLHLETDAPYLGPKNYKSRRSYNEPANLPHIAREVAELRGQDVTLVAETCSANSIKLFRLGQ